MRKKLIITIFITLVIIAVAVHYLFLWNPFKPLQSVSIQVKGLERKFYFYRPHSLKPNPSLVFVLHGSDMNAKTMRMVTGREFDRLADKTKEYIIVYPQGYKKYWNDCRKQATYDAKRENINDVQFFIKMIEFFSEKYGIHTERVFAAGFSNGGQMCIRLAREAPHHFRGFAIFNANLPVSANDDCTSGNQPVSILLINGTADPVNPYNGGEVVMDDGEKRGPVMDAETSVKYWMQLAGCKYAVKGIFNQNGKEIEAVKTFSCIADSTGKKVQLMTVVGGGHNIPNPRFFLWPKRVGPVNKELNAPKAALHFFRQL